MGIDDRAPCYSEGPNTIYRASFLGACMRSLVAARRGYSPLPLRQFFADAAAEGNLHEPDIIAKIAAAHHLTDVRHTGDEQIEKELPIGAGIIVRCHPDGIGYDGGEPVVALEAKSMSRDVWNRFDAKTFEAEPSYGWQASAEMAATGLPLLLGYKNRNNGKVKDLYLDTPPHSTNDIKVRISKAEALARKEDIEVVDVECDIRGLSCLRYAYLHNPGRVAEAGSDFPLSEMEVVQVDMLAESYARAREAEKIAATTKAEIRDQLMELIGETDQVASPRFKVTRSVQVRHRLNEKKLAEVIDLEPFRDSFPVTQLRVTEIGG